MSGKATSLTLLERLKDPADGDAWQEFHDCYGPWVRHYLTRRGVRGADAEDIQQEVMQLASSELERFEHNGRTGALRCWLRQVVANRLRTHYRVKNREGIAVGGSDFRALADQLEDPRSAPSRLWDEQYHRWLCQYLFQRIKDEFQPQTLDAFQRVAVQGKSSTEVASELGMTSGAVRSAQFRVTKRLREISQGMLD